MGLARSLVEHINRARLIDFHNGTAARAQLVGRAELAAGVREVLPVPPTAAASTLGAPTGINAGVTHWISYASGYLIAYTKGTGAAWLDQTSTSSPWVTSIGAVTGLTVGWDAFVPM